METVGPQLAHHSLVGIDTSLFIYLFEDSPTYSNVATAVLEQVESGVTSGITSTVSLMEVVVKPLQLGNTEVAEYYATIIAGFPNLIVAGIDADVARQAAFFRAIYNIRPADALQLGACQHGGATAFVTNDKRLRRVTEFEIVILDDYIH